MVLSLFLSVCWLVGCSLSACLCLLVSVGVPASTCHGRRPCHLTSPISLTVSETDFTVQCYDAKENSKLRKKCSRTSRFCNSQSMCNFNISLLVLLYSNNQCWQSWSSQFGCDPRSGVCETRGQDCVSFRMSTENIPSCKIEPNYIKFAGH